jgi:hypothetical protein
MLAGDKSFAAFDCPEKPLSFVRIYRMLNVFSMRSEFQVFQSVVSTIKVLVVYLQSAFNRAVKRFPHNAMHSAGGVLSVFAKRYLPIAFQQVGFARAMIYFPRPSLPKFDSMGCGNADAKKFCGLLKRRAFGKHLLDCGNFGCVKNLAASYAAHVAVIADFVQVFKAKHWFPRFHASPLFNVNRSMLDKFTSCNCFS